MTAAVKVAIGVLAAEHPDGWKVLITQRPHHSVLGGYWEFPGGKQERDESLHQCVVREFEEELALTVAVTETLAHVEHTYDHGVIRLHAYLCDHLAGQPKALEVAAFRWVHLHDLPTYRFPPANTAILERIHERLSTP